MMIREIVIAAVTLGSLTSIGVAAEDPKPLREESRADEVQRLATPLIESGVVPSMVIGLYDAGRVEVYGFGSTGAPRGNTPDGRTIYEIGSITKVFTGLLLADAVERGTVKLQDPLSRLLPEGIKAPKFVDKEITLEHLATHRSALPRIPSNMADDLRDPYADYDSQDLFEFLNGHTLALAPGTSYAYSNLGMGLLGELLARKAGSPYEDLLKRVTKPLKMTDTVVTLSDEQKKRRARPHRDGLAVHPWRFDALCGCGGIRSTVDDMLKFIAANVEPHSTPLAKAIALASAKRTNDMSIGWHRARDGITLFHTGQTGGYSAGLFVCPKFKKGVVVLANGASTHVSVLSERLIQMLFGMPVDPPRVRKPVEVSRTDLAKLVGEYPSSLGFTIHVTVEEGVLFARLTGQVALRVYPESATRFFYHDLEADLGFELDTTGKKATAVTLFQNGREMRCPRKEES